MTAGDRPDPLPAALDLPAAHQEYQRQRRVATAVQPRGRTTGGISSAAGGFPMVEEALPAASAPTSTQAALPCTPSHQRHLPTPIGRLLSAPQLRVAVQTVSRIRTTSGAAGITLEAFAREARYD